jgi:hypothetical protein
LTILFLITVKRFFDTIFYAVGASLSYKIMLKPNWEDGEKLLEKLQIEKKKTRILNIFIGSEAESSELSPTKNRTENDQLDDEKPSNQ